MPPPMVLVPMPVLLVPMELVPSGVTAGVDPIEPEELEEPMDELDVPLPMELLPLVEGVVTGGDVMGAVVVSSTFFPQAPSAIKAASATAVETTGFNFVTFMSIPCINRLAELQPAINLSELFCRLPRKKLLSV